MISKTAINMLGRFVTLFCLMVAVPAYAQSAPSCKPLTIIVPYAAGGVTDMLARFVGDILRRETGQTVIVENKTGAGGAIAGIFVTRAAPDGCTLLMTSSGINSLTPVVYKEFNASELTQISVLVDVPFAVVVGKDFPHKTLRDFVAFAKQKPGEIKMGNASMGSHGHLTQIMLSKALNIDLSAIPYKGSMPAINDLLGGHIDAEIDNAGVLKTFIDSGKVTALFVTSSQRSAALPGVPTAKELGVQFESVAWFGLAGPKRMPPGVVDYYRTVIANGLKADKTVEAKLIEVGLTLVLSTPAEAAARTKEDDDRLGTLAKSLNLSQN